MKLAEFHVGLVFTSALRAQSYCVTDVGSRVVVAQLHSPLDNTPGAWLEFVFPADELAHCAPAEDHSTEGLEDLL